MNNLLLKVKNVELYVVTVFKYYGCYFLSVLYDLDRRLVSDIKAIEFRLRQEETRAKTVIKVDAAALFEALYGKAYPSETVRDGKPAQDYSKAAESTPEVSANPEGQQPDGPAPKPADNGEVK